MYKSIIGLFFIFYILSLSSCATEILNNESTSIIEARSINPSLVYDHIESKPWSADIDLSAFSYSEETSNTSPNKELVSLYLEENENTIEIYLIVEDDQIISSYRSDLIKGEANYIIKFYDSNSLPSLISYYNESLIGTGNDGPYSEVSDFTDCVNDTSIEFLDELCGDRDTSDPLYIIEMACRLNAVSYSLTRATVICLGLPWWP